MNWDNLSISDKAELIKIYVSNGILDLNSIKDHYNNNGGKLTFKQWKAQMQSKYPDIEMDNNRAGYDYETYFNNHYDDAIKQLSNLQHFPDTYKLPNHPTFSNESIYSRGPVMGGTWNSDDTFAPSVINEQYYPNRYDRTGNYTEQRIYNRFPHQYPDGGPTDTQSDWSRKYSQQLALQQLGWDNPNNNLQSDYAAKDSNGYYAGYRLKPVTVKAEHPIRQWDRDISIDNPYINQLYQNYLNREEAGKEYLKNIGRVGLAIGTLPMLSYGAVAAPLATGLSLAGSSGLNYGINKFTPYDSWGNMLAEEVFNTDNELAQTALEFTNPGFILGFKAAPFVNNQYRGLKVANELRKSIRNTELQPRVVKNSAHIRTRLGDVEIDDHNLMYHVDNGDYTGFSGNGAYIKDGMLFPSQHSNGQKPYTWWNLGSPYRNGQTRLLTATKDNSSLLRVRDQDYPIGQWTGNPKDRTFVTNQEYVSSEPIKIGNQYEYIPNYGYRRVQEPIPTLDRAMQEATINQQNNPIVFARSLSNEGVDNVLRDNYLEGSPSFALTRYSDNNLERLSDLYSGDEGITFLFGKNAAGNNAKYFIGDADTPIRQDAARALNLPATDEAINNITPEQVMLGKRLLHKDINSTTINWREAFNLTRENNFGDMDYFYNEVLLDKILDYRDAIGAIVNTNKPQYIKMLEDLGIPYGYNLADIPFNFKGFQQGGSLSNE